MRYIPRDDREWTVKWSRTLARSTDHDEMQCTGKGRRQEREQGWEARINNRFHIFPHRSDQLIRPGYVPVDS